MTEPVDVERALGRPGTYEDAILRIFTKRRQRGQAFAEAGRGVSYFDTVAGRRGLARAIARDVAAGRYRPEPVGLWSLENKGKIRDAHQAEFTDQVVGSALYQLLSHNAACYGMPGVYSYLPGVTNASAMRALAQFVREHRERSGHRGPPLYVLQSDFDQYGDTLPVGPDAPIWTVLREIASLGRPSGQISDDLWELITTLARPVVRNEDGTHFVRTHGVAMGTPLVPLLGNLAVLPMDRAVMGIDGVFYARYNDDFVVAHSDLGALREADTRIDALLPDLGVRRKIAKERRTALCGNGMDATHDSRFRGATRVDCLGLSVFFDGTMAVGPHRVRRLMRRIARRIDAAAQALVVLPVPDRARHLVSAANVMLDADSPFAVAGLSALLESTTDRGTLKDLDHRIARKIVQAATGRPGVRGFRILPPRTLRGEMGLASLVALRNAR